MKFLMFFFSLIFTVSAQADTVYKTVDKNGNVIFSDKPSKGAKEIKLPKLKTIKNPNTPTYHPLSQKTEVPDPYRLITITSPENDQTLRNNAGDFTLSVSLQPGLRQGHRLVITMDGKEVSNGTATRVSLKNADRGTHKLGAKVLDASGKTLISTSSVFHLFRASR